MGESVSIVSSLLGTYDSTSGAGSRPGLLADGPRATSAVDEAAEGSRSSSSYWGQFVAGSSTRAKRSPGKLVDDQACCSVPTWAQDWAATAVLPLSCGVLLYAFVYVYLYWDSMWFGGCSQTLRLHLAWVAALTAAVGFAVTLVAFRAWRRRALAPPVWFAALWDDAENDEGDAYTMLGDDVSPGDSEEAQRRRAWRASAVWRRAWRASPCGRSVGAMSRAQVHFTWNAGPRIGAPVLLALGLWMSFALLVTEAHYSADRCVKLVEKLEEGTSTGTLAAGLYHSVHDHSTPNVLVLMVDDLRYDGPWMAHAPHMQKLITSGHTFENAYCTWSVCGPSRTSILTGMRPMTIGFTQNHAEALHGQWALRQWQTLPQTFHGASRFTASIGKVNHNNYGRGEFEYDVRPEVSPYCFNGEVLWCDYSWWRPYQNDAAIADAAIDVIDKIDASGTAFLTMVGFHKPHVPWPILPEDWDLNAHVFEGVSRDMRVQPAYARLPDNNGLPGLGGIGRAPGSRRWWNFWQRRLVDYNDAGPPWSLESDYETKILRRAYASAITRTDRELGRVVAAAESKSWYEDNTIVVFMADHGFALGESGKTGKHDLLDVQMRVPLSIVLPTHVELALAASGRVARRFVSTLDLYPTLARLANISTDLVPHQLEGVDLYAPRDEPKIVLNLSAEVIQSAAASGARLPRVLKQAHYPVIDHGDGRALAVEGFRYVAWEREENPTTHDYARGDDGDDAAQVVEELYRFDLEVYDDLELMNSTEQLKNSSGNIASNTSTASTALPSDWSTTAADRAAAAMGARHMVRVASATATPSSTSAAGVEDGRHATYAEFESVAPTEPQLAAALHTVLKSMLVTPTTATAGKIAIGKSVTWV